MQFNKEVNMTNNKPLDWAAVDRDYEEYCRQCQQEGKKPDDFGKWFMSPLPDGETEGSQD
jgi:hypothetical protein